MEETPGPLALSGPSGEAAAAVRRAAFGRLRRGASASVSDLAEGTGLTVEDVRAAVGSLAAAGGIEVDAVGRVVGAGGLSLLPTRHRLVLSGVALHTWCALDAVGIPAALGEDAGIATSCPFCGSPIEIALRAGRSIDQRNYVAWLPTMECSKVREEFCPQANLFCDGGHLEAWRAAAGHPPGRVLSLAEVEETGRTWWGDLR